MNRRAGPDRSKCVFTRLVVAGLVATAVLGCAPSAQSRYANLRAAGSGGAPVGGAGDGLVDVAGNDVAGGARGFAAAEFPDNDGRRGRVLPQPLQSASADEPFVLVSGAADPSVPEDFDLGPLFDEGRAEGALAGAAAVVRVLFADLARGQIPRESLDPDRRFVLGLQLEDVVGSAVLPSGAVIGRPVSSGDASAEFPIRVESPRGSASGYVYLITRRNQWYITDIHVDFRLLEHPEEARDRAYEPTTYEWTIRRP